MNALVNALKQYQEREGLKTCDLATQIGITEAMLYYIYSGKKKIGDKTIRGIIQNISILIPDCLKFYMEG